MKINKLNAAIILFTGVIALSSCKKDEEEVQPDPALSTGTNITLRNTLEESGTPEETYASLFGASDDAFDEHAVIANLSPEFETALAQPDAVTGIGFDINGLYHIDFTESDITFTLLPDANDSFWSGNFGVFPAGKFDRYYFTLSQSHNISSFTCDDSHVNLRMDSENVIVVELSEGYDFNPGKSFKISLK